MPAKIDISGKKYGMLTVICDSGKRNNNKKVLWHCKCDCGNKVIHSSSELNYGKAKSCGCLKHEFGEVRKKYNARDRKLYFR